MLLGQFLEGQGTVALLPGWRRENASQMSEGLGDQGQWPEDGEGSRKGVTTEGLRSQSSLKMPNGEFGSGSHGALLLTFLHASVRLSFS